MSSVYHAHPAPPMSKTARALTLMGVLAIFQVTQSLVSTRPEPESVAAGDQLLVGLSPLSDWFWTRPDAVRWLLIVTSALVDLCGVGILVFGALGPSTRPIIAITFICFMRYAGPLIDCRLSRTSDRLVFVACAVQSIMCGVYRDPHPTPHNVYRNRCSISARHLQNSQ